jgi:hypothetical protein
MEKWFAGIALLVLASPVWAGEESLRGLKTASGTTVIAAKAIKSGADCAGGWQLDDGSFELGFGFDQIVGPSRAAMTFETGGPARIDTVCVCVARIGGTATTFDSAIEIWSADPETGVPLTRLRQVDTTFLGVTTVPAFYRIAIPGGVRTQGSKVALGMTWPTIADSTLFLCDDANGPGGGEGSFAEFDVTSPSAWSSLANNPSYKAFGLRAEVTELPPDPDPPAGPWLSSPTLPGFDFKIRVNGAAAGIQVADCVPETVCVAGALPTRTELFLRVIGPRPNGFRWVEGVRFTTSRLEIWARGKSTAFPDQEFIRYYDLPAVPANSLELPGLVDPTAF